MSGSGLIFSTDLRDKQFAFSEISPSRPPITEKEWWADGWWGNQGNTPHCCAYSWVHLLEDGPVIQDKLTKKPTPIISPEKFYLKCKEIDGLDGKGTTIHAGAQVAKSLGLVSEYRWATTIDEVVDALLIFGPVLAGTHWYTGMEAGPNGRMKPTGRLDGGHAYVINGVNVTTQMLRIKNSYGKSWGKQGYGYISFEDFSKLLKDGGTVLVPFENKLESLPVL